MSDYWKKRIISEYYNLEFSKIDSKNTELIEFTQAVLRRILRKDNIDTKPHLEMSLNVNTRELDGVKLSKTELKLLKLFIDKKCVTKRDIAEIVYEQELDSYLKRSIAVAIYRLGKKGVNFKTKYNYGYMLVDTINIEK